MPWRHSTIPEGRHEIQVLDDSTDETRMIVAEKVRLLRQQGIDIHHITRDDREGFKAGALRERPFPCTGRFCGHIRRRLRSAA
jgi:hypothetical protein